MASATPHPASTVVLLRPSATRFEVFLVRRHHAIAFLGGAHVFPGGRVDEADGDGDEGLRHRLAAVRELHEEAGVRVSPDALLPFAHWVTPEIEIRRYDTWFFVAVLPSEQQAAHDGLENTESLWVDPADAIGMAVRGELALPPPTWMTLRQLTSFSHVDDVLAWARGVEILRIQPGFEERNGVKVLTVPGEPPTRFVLMEGRWVMSGV